ncbi:MAG: hypothetical protein U0793_25100 [Gemmataceae bacterium]
MYSALLTLAAFAPPETPAWLSDFAAAQREAKRDDKPILAVLH